MMKKILILLVLGFGLLLSPDVLAQGPDGQVDVTDSHTPMVVDVMPAGPSASDLNIPVKNAQPGFTGTHPTHDDIYLTPDRSELVRLEQEATSIIIGNPLHLSVLADNSKTLVLVPKRPGSTFITVLDKDSNVIMQRHVIVAAPKDKQYIRVRKACAMSDDEKCQSTDVYYCPDTCHSIGIAEEGDTSDGESTEADAGGDQSAGGSSSESETDSGGE